MIQFFYVSPADIDKEFLILRRSEAFHLRKVLRLKKGDPLVAVDGVGNGYKAEVDTLSPQKVICRIMSRVRRLGEPAHTVTLAAGLSTGYKFDDLIQRGTELGLSKFVPLLTEKSKVKIEKEKRLESKLTRWRKVAIASMKQCGRSFLPEIIPPIKFDQFMVTIDNPDKKILFTPGGQKRLNTNLIVGTEAAITLIVGPESGFSSAEVTLAAEKGCRIVSLGDRILRTENASPAFLAIIMFLLGEMN